MLVKKLLRVFLLCLCVTLLSCTGPEDKEEPVVFKQVPEIKEIKPHKPVKVKLKRNTKGEYAWDISGDNADEIIETDRKLRESFEKSE